MNHLPLTWLVLRFAAGLSLQAHILNLAVWGALYCLFRIGMNALS